ncbi:SDR family NAD(P)-dependent oxidoreductase [Actinoplanes sp. NPDC051343]|uniref:SDR family NAD(P)-dependent oxidoreductase n=1 Tax=Actinoplanes sp. NPDC051343 TaxID=3363906 RepID=UPI0037B50346
MTQNERVALVTGATQGLGRALCEALARKVGTVYVTGRSAGAVRAVAEELGVRGEVFDVAEPEAAQRLATTIEERHGGIDIVVGNAVMRIGPEDDERKIIHEYAEVNNFGTTRLLRAFAPLLRDGGRLAIVASSLGTLRYLAPVLHPRFDGDPDEAIRGWRDDVASGRARASAWPSFINIPSKIGQVAAVRTLAATRRADDVRRGIMLLAVCPGMINTPTSGLWWDVSGAPTPAEAAAPLADLLLGPARPELYGELVRDGQVLDWGAVSD